MATKAEEQSVQELLRETWGLAYSLGDCGEQYDQLIEALESHSDGMKRDDLEATFAVYEAVSEAWHVLHQLSEALFTPEVQLLDRANKLYDEAEAQDL